MSELTKQEQQLAKAAAQMSHITLGHAIQEMHVAGLALSWQSLADFLKANQGAAHSQVGHAVFVAAALASIGQSDSSALPTAPH